SVGDEGIAYAAVAGMIHVGTHGVLGGFGTVGGIDLSGTLATGHSIGTLHVTGDVTFRPGSQWTVDVAADGRSDALDVGGDTHILGGSVLALGADGDWQPRTEYTVLTAKGDVDGQFDSVSSNLAFLTPSFDYGAHAVTLILERNSVDFTEVARTPN